MQTVDDSTDAEACDPRSDGYLLLQFLKENSEEAFAQLMNRHGPYILGVCRRMTAHAQDAEDAFQACFLELIRHARSIKRAESVVGWLQTVATRLARRAKKQRDRRRQTEMNEAMSEVLVFDEDASWREVKRLLDTEIARLPEILRSAVILCLFEGRTQEEAAQFLEVNVRTLKARVARGRQQLHIRLKRHGVSLALIGAVLTSSNAQAAVPSALHAETLRGGAAILNKTALTGIVSPAVLGLIGSSSLLSGWGVIALVFAALIFSAAGAFAVRGYLDEKKPRQTVSQTFRGSRFDSQFFELSRSDSSQYVRLTREGLQITLPSENGPTQPIGVKVRPIIRGDFELEASFEILQLDLADSAKNAGVTLYFFMDDAEWNGVWFGKMIDKEHGPVFVLGHRAGQREQRTTQFMDAVATGDEGGIVRLRVVRRNGEFNLSATHGEHSEFQHIGTLEIGAADLKTIRFATDWGSSDRAVRPNVPMDVRLLDFSMTADEFVDFDP